MAVGAVTLTPAPQDISAELSLAADTVYTVQAVLGTVRAEVATAAPANSATANILDPRQVAWQFSVPSGSKLWAWTFMPGSRIVVTEAPA